VENPKSATTFPFVDFAFCKVAQYCSLIFVDWAVRAFSRCPLPSRKAGVQKVCKNVQSQNQHLKTAPDFYATG
jgi:hypothetical protein